MDFIITEIIPFMKNHPILSLAWIGLFIAIIFLTVKSKLSKIKVISSGQAVFMINKGNGVIVDVRSADTYKKGHITDSYNILPVDIKNGSIKNLDKHKTDPVILVDDNGLSVSALSESLAKQGFTHIYAIKDGIAGWNGDNLPLVKK